MKKLFKEITITALIVFTLIALLQFPVNATNEDLEIVKTENEYLLYSKTVMPNEFYFAFSKDNNAEPLDYIKSMVDAEGNNVAYVDSDLENTFFKDENGERVSAYMWIKTDEKVAEPVIVDLDTAITQDVINEVNALTTRIPVTIGQEQREPVTEGNTTVTTTVGYLQIEPQEGYTYEYQLIQLPNENYSRFVELAKEISNFAENSNSYENISKINEFYNLYQSLIPENWVDVEENRIEQPEEARNGTEYIVWIKATNAEQTAQIVDVQFMTSVREEAEQRSTETVTEEVTTTTKLPVTFDSNIILIIALAVIIVAIVVLLVIKKKNSNKNS